MERKYKITAAETIIPMMVTFRKPDSDERYTVSVGVNYLRDQVVFHDKSFEGIDYEDLEQEILAQLRPAPVKQPNLPSDIFDRVNKVKSGEYQAAFNQHIPEVGK